MLSPSRCQIIRRGLLYLKTCIVWVEFSAEPVMHASPAVTPERVVSAKRFMGKLEKLYKVSYLLIPLSLSLPWVHRLPT